MKIYAKAGRVGVLSGDEWNDYVILLKPKYIYINYIIIHKSKNSQIINFGND